MQMMINRNTPFPCQRKHFFTTTRDNQSEFQIRIFEGDEAKTSDNEYLGQFTLENLSLQPAGSLKIEVTFDIAGDRNLTVTVTELSTERHLKARITSDWISKVNYDDIQSKKGEASQLQEGSEDVPMMNEEFVVV